MVLRVDSPEAVAAGLSVAQIGQTVRAAFDGVVATTIKSLGDEIDVRVSLDEKSRKDAATLGQILIPNPRGAQSRSRGSPARSRRRTWPPTSTKETSARSG